MSTIEFLGWLQDELKERGWSQLEFSKRSGLSPSQISRLLQGERGPGEESLNGIAKAFNIPPEIVFRKAGILPPESKENAKTEELAHLARTMPEAALDDVLEFARHRYRLAEKRGEYNENKTEQGA